MAVPQCCSTRLLPNTIRNLEERLPAVRNVSNQPGGRCFGFVWAPSNGTACCATRFACPLQSSLSRCLQSSLARCWEAFLCFRNAFQRAQRKAFSSCAQRFREAGPQARARGAWKLGRHLGFEGIKVANKTAV